MEESDGIRYSWNVWPNSRLEATRIAAPLGCLYAPTRKNNERTLKLPYEPVVCKDPCRAILNPFCRVDFVGKIWTCPFCQSRNHFPQHYAQSITETSLPGEMIPGYTTVEYTRQRNNQNKPVFLFVVDTATIEEELDALKQSLIVTLNLIPEDCFVGLITFGTIVQLYDLAFTTCVKSYVFRGDKDIALGKVQELLGSFRRQGQPGGQQGQADPLRRFLVPRGECEYQLSSILEDLQPDPWPVQPGHRPLRCTGAAISVASSLLELGFPGSGGRLMTFISGPCTLGPGQVVSTNLEERIRSHQELTGGTAPHFANADKFYQSVASRLVKNGHTMDVFACALDQVGLCEMRHLWESTGGCLVNHEAFKGGVQGDVFVQSLMKMFETDEEGNLKMAFNGKVEVNCSRGYKVSGCIGSVASLAQKGPQVGEVEIGIGGTKAWSIGSLMPGTTLAFFFEIVNTDQVGDQRQMYLQFVTSYQTPTGQTKVRVTTQALNQTDTTKGLDALSRGFDQEAAAVLTARLVSHRARTEEAFDVMRWLDRMLIRACGKFGQYQKDDATSFHLPQNFSIFPQFIFHLRRSQFLQVFNSSPDETIIFRQELNKQCVSNGLLMIQPTLICYSLAGEPAPVLLDNTSIAPDRLLLLDSFFWVTLWTGETIAAWRNQGYHEMPGYENVKQLLEDPKEDLRQMIQDRFPVPRIIETDQHKSQARFLIAKLNPAVTQANASGGYGASANELVYTDDVSLQVFLEHLSKLAVQGQ